MSEDEKTFEGQLLLRRRHDRGHGSPEGAGYCHCAACRSWSAGPVNAFTLWKPEAVKVTQGEDQIGEYNRNERSHRVVQGLRRPSATRHPQWAGRRLRGDDPRVSVEPGVHVNYESTVLPMKDGLPKLKDFPAEMGGSARRSPSIREAASTAGSSSATSPSSRTAASPSYGVGPLGDDREPAPAARVDGRAAPATG